jgi:predicted site-specific integrase-resolvase
VSSHEQKQDLERQKEIIELFCAEGALADAS